MSRWSKKLDGGKLTDLVNKKNRGGLDCNRKDKNYIEKFRKTHFPLVPYNNSNSIYARKTNQVSTDFRLKGVRKSIGEFSSILY